MQRKERLADGVQESGVTKVDPAACRHRELEMNEVDESATNVGSTVSECECTTQRRRRLKTWDGFDDDSDSALDDSERSTSVGDASSDSDSTHSPSPSASPTLSPTRSPSPSPLETQTLDDFEDGPRSRCNTWDSFEDDSNGFMAPL